MMQWMAQAAMDLAQQTQSASGGGIGSDGWKVITFLCAAIGGMFLWLKLKDKRIEEIQDARVADIKDHLKRVMDENEQG